MGHYELLRWTIIQELQDSLCFSSVLSESEKVYLQQQESKYLDIVKLSHQYTLGISSTSSKRTDIKEHHLKSIFSTLEVEGVKGDVSYWKKASLSFDGDFYTDSNTVVQNSLDDIVHDLIADLNTIRPLWNDVEQYTETLLNILHHRTALLPCGYAEDISFYDYVKMKGGIAIALAAEGCSPEEPFLLVGGTIPSIQSFIYGIISKFAAKNLKGRSFFVQLLIDAVTKYTIQELQLSTANIVYASGGNTYIIAPNNEVIKDKLAKIEETLVKNLFEEYGTALTFSLAWTPLSVKKIQEQKLSEIWKKLSEILGEKKYRKFLPSNNIAYENLFEPIEVGGEAERDAITNEELKKDAVPLRYNTEGKKINKSTQEQITIGEKLREAKYIIELRSVSAISKTERKIIAPASLGIGYYLVAENESGKLNRIINDLGGSSNISQLYTINKFDFLPKEEILPISYGFMLYGGNEFNEKDFSELAAFNEKDSKEYKNEYKRLGVLRMDVDNLGSIFVDSFHHKYGNASLVRYASLSRNMDFFFKGYLNEIWRKGARDLDNNELNFRDYIQILYSGGDDLFMVGKWDCVIGIAHEIAKEFKKYVAGHKKLTISGGVTLVTHKFPIIKAAELAGKAEKEAKKFNNDEKNAFAIENTPISWQDEFDLMQELKGKFKHKEFPKSLLMKIQSTHISLGQRNEKNDKRWIWRLAYDIARAKDRLKNKNEKVLIEFLNELAIGVFANSIHRKNKKIDNYLSLASIAARLAEMEERSNKKK